MPIAVGQTWQVSGQAPSGWVSKSVKITALESVEGDPEYMRYSPSSEGVMKAAFDSTQPGAVSFNTENNELRFLWSVGDPSVSYTCKIVAPTPGAQIWNGELRASGNPVGTCTATQGEVATAAPADLPASPLASPTPLASGQTWTIRGTGRMNSTATVKVAAVYNPNPGVYTNAEGLGILDTLAGRGAPVVTLNKGARNMNFVWSDAGTAYLCKINNPADGAHALNGELVVRDAVVGSCTATLN